MPVRVREAPQASARDAGGDPLGGAPSLVFVHLVADEQPEESLQPVLHVVGEGIPPGTGAVRLPEGIAAAGAAVAAAGEVALGEGHALVIDDGGVALGAAGDAEGFARLVVPHQLAPRDGPALYHGGRPAVGELRPFA